MSTPVSTPVTSPDCPPPAGRSGLTRVAGAGIGEVHDGLIVRAGDLDEAAREIEVDDVDPA